MRFSSIDRVNAVFWVILVLITQGAVWLLPLPSFVKIGLTWFLLFMNGMNLIVLNKGGARSYGNLSWIKMFIFGIMLTVLGIEANPELRSAFSSLLKFDVVQSTTKFQSVHGNPANFIMFVGLAITYGGIVGIVRLAFIRGVKRVLATKQGQNGQYPS